MIVYKTCLNDLNEALLECNRRFANNITFRTCIKKTKNAGTYNVRLDVRSSSANGAKQNVITGRHIHAACWHVHGVFIEELLKRGCIISSMHNKLTTNADNWKNEELRIHGQIIMASDMCAC